MGILSSNRVTASRMVRIGVVVVLGIAVLSVLLWQLARSTLAESAFAFDSALSKLHATTGADDQEIHQIEKEALTGSVARGLDPLKAVRGMLRMAAYRRSSAEILKLAPMMEEFAITSDLDFELTVEFVEATLNSYGLPDEYLPYVLAQMQTTLDLFPVRAASLAQNMQKALPGASLYRSTMTDVLLLIGVLAGTQYSEDEVGIVISSVLTRLADPAARAVLEAHGVTVVDRNSGAFRSFVDVFDDLKPRLATDAGHRSALLMKAFGDEGASVIEVLSTYLTGGIRGSDRAIRNAAALQHAKEIIGGSVDTVSAAFHRREKTPPAVQARRLAAKAAWRIAMGRRWFKR